MTTLTVFDTLTALESNGLTLPIADMAPATVAYLLANGFSQSLTDARTTAAARAVETFAKATKASKAEIDAWRATEDGKATIEAAGKEAMRKRLEALTEGTMVYGARGPNGPRKSPLEDYLWRTAEAEVRTFLRGKNIAFPKEREAAEKAINAWIDAHRKRLEADFRKQAKVAEGADDVLAAMGLV